MKEELKEIIKREYNNAEDKVLFLNEIRAFLHELSPRNNNPVDFVRWVKLEDVMPNDYNPNIVPKRELQLLKHSIEKDGYTQPIVTIYDEEKKKYVIVDGFHRYFVMKHYDSIKKSCGGLLPIVIIKGDINDLMASTIRHNRARGQHQIIGMSDVIFKMLENGWSDEDICKELGMEADELVRLKHITGFSKLFENVEYRKAWENKRQILLKKKWQEENEGERGFEYKV